MPLQDTKETRAIDLDGKVDEDDRKAILSRALDTEQADAEGMLNKIRSRFDTCAPAPYGFACTRLRCAVHQPLNETCLAAASCWLLPADNARI